MMQGSVVVWKRDPATATHDQPSGMGVKFIKLTTTEHIIDWDQRGDRDGRMTRRTPGGSRRWWPSGRGWRREAPS